MASLGSHMLYISSKDREAGSANDFQIAPFNFTGAHRAFSLALVSATIPNTVPTVKTNVNDKWYCSVNSVDKSGITPIPEGYYTGDTYASALKTYLDAVTGGTNTVSYSATTNKITITFGIPSGGLTFSSLGSYSSSFRKTGSTERALELAGFRYASCTASNLYDVNFLKQTITTGQVWVGSSPVKLNGTNYVDIMTNLRVNALTSASAASNILQRISMSTGVAANIQSWELQYPQVGHHVVAQDFRPRFYLVDEWGDAFIVPPGHEVSLVFMLESSN